MASRSFSRTSGTGGGTSGGLWENVGATIIKPKAPTTLVSIPGAMDLSVTSDKNHKDNIKDIDKECIEKMAFVNPKQFTFKEDSKGKLRYGFIAQELEEVFPNLVMEVDNNGTKGVNYLEIIPLLLLKIQDLQNQVDELKK